jgi:hypothetical protein
MSFFSRLFKGRPESSPEPELQPSPKPEAPPEPAPPPEAVVVLRRGMSIPKDEYVAQVVALAFPGGLPSSVRRFGLAQPSWFKSEEIADSMASDVAATFAQKLGLAEHSHRRHVLAGPEGAPVMIIELHRE